MGVGAVVGRVTDYDRFVRAEQLAHPQFLDEAIERLEMEVERRLSLFREEMAQPDSIPGMPDGHRRRY